MSKKARAVPLAKNKDVRELLALMEANNLPTAKDLRDVVAQVTALEQDLQKAVGELAAARQELAEAQNHPFKASMQNTVDSMQAL